MARDIAEQYTSELREELQHLAIWLPGDRVSLGDVGVMDGDRFIRQSTLAETVGLGLGGTRNAPWGGFSYRSEGAVSVSVGALAGAKDPVAAVGKAGGRVKVTFDREHAVLLEMRGGRRVAVEDQLHLQTQLTRAWERDAWKPEWCVVTEVVESAETTVLVSTQSKASIDLETDVALDPGGLASLADAKLGLRRSVSDGIGIEMLAEPGATPLFKALRLKKGFWGRSPKVVLEGLEPVSPDEDAAEEQLFDLLGED
jgi:hypothetical protein